MQPQAPSVPARPIIDVAAPPKPVAPMPATVPAIAVAPAPGVTPVPQAPLPSPSPILQNVTVKQAPAMPGALARAPGSGNTLPQTVKPAAVAQPILTAAQPKTATSPGAASPTGLIITTIFVMLTLAVAAIAVYITSQK